MRVMKFRGQSGKAYPFTRVAPNSPWARSAGVALFAAQGPFGWRVVKLTPLQGNLHDIQPIWAYADAERYGARAVFILHDADIASRTKAIRDLEAGLSPVCTADLEPVALAA